MNAAASTAPEAFVRHGAPLILPPPAATTGAVGWVRQNLLSSPINIVLTVLSLALVAWILPGIIRFFIIDAVWSGPDRESCIAKDGQPLGACWAFIRERFSYFIYASYPISERWRVNVYFILGAIGIAWLLWPSGPRRDLASIYFFGAFPFLAYALLTGANPLGLLSLPLNLLSLPPWALALAVIAFAAVIYGIARGTRSNTPLYIGGFIAAFAILGPAIWYVSEQLWNAIGLRKVGTHLWGGLMVTTVVAGVGIVASLPLGILLALGRRSRLPLVKFFSVVFIEFVRGVPLITILFMANTMLPLFIQGGENIDKLMRALVGVALFSSAYLAEVVRSGLQALPKGQYEGAMAMGLNYAQMMRLIILPQALKVSIPNIVSSYIGLFKDTSLLLIVGIFDFLKAIENGRIDPQWAAPTTSVTGYAFAAIVFFVFCYGMSRYAKYMEHLLAAGDRR